MTTIAKMSSAQAAKELAQTEERIREVQERIAEIRPPRPAPPAPPGGTSRDFDPLTGAGPEFRAADESEDLERLHALRSEYERLSTEEGFLLRRREQLRQRERRARDEEARKAAPKEAKRLAKGFPDLAERIRASSEELRSVRDELQASIRELAAARNLIGDDAPGIDAATLSALWHAPLRPGQKLDVEIEMASGRARSTRFFFGKPSRSSSSRRVP